MADFWTNLGNWAPKRAIFAESQKENGRNIDDEHDDLRHLAALATVDFP